MPEPSTLAELIGSHARRSPTRTYLEDARSDRTITYGALAQAVDAWNTLLEQRAVPAEAVVVVDVGDPLGFALAHLAVIASGRRSVPADPSQPWSSVRRLADVAGCDPLIVSDRDEPGDAGGSAVIGVDRTTGLPVAPSTGDADADATWASTGDGNAPPTTPRFAGRGGALLFTSGSTGAPKGVPLPEAQLLFTARAIAQHNGLTADDRGYNPLPLFHVNAQVVGLLATLVVGASLVLDRSFHRTGFWQVLEQRNVTWLNAVPAILAVLTRDAAAAVPERVRFIRSASAPLPDAVREALSGVPLVISWGMTEAASQITATPVDAEPRAGSVGVPVGDEVQVRSADGAVLDADAIGDLWIRGPGVIHTYFDGAAADRFDADGWLHTGDVGSMDADGWVYLAGRSDDVINRGGEKVYPLEVEEVLLGDPRVREAIVVGRPDPILHAVPVAYVIPTDSDEAVDEAGLIAHLTELTEQALPRFKRPVEITVVADVPRGPTGKVQRSKIVQAEASA